MSTAAPAKICTICAEPMTTQVIASASGEPVMAHLCYRCDRRVCKECDTPEPTGIARSCANPSCKETW